MESRIDESKLKIFKPRLEKSMLGIGDKFYSSSSANAGIAGMATSSSTYRCSTYDM